MPAKKEAPSAARGLEGLRARLDERGLESCYLLVGDDRRGMDEAIAELEKRAVPDELRGFNSLRLRGGDDAFDDVARACATLPMLGDRRFVLVREPERLDGEADMLVRCAREASPSTTLVLVPASLDRRLGWVKALEAACTVISFAAPVGRELDTHVRSTLRRLGFQIDDDALALLADLVRAETLLLASELDKLALCCQGRDRITVDDVDSVLGRSRAADNWALSNAIEDGDPDAALTALRHLRDQGAAVPMLVGTLDWCLGRLVASEEPRTFPARQGVLERRRNALRGRGAELYELLRSADRLFRTTGGAAEAALERFVVAASS